MIPGGNSSRPSSGIVLAGLIWLSISQLLVRQGYVWQKSTELRCVNELSKRLRGEMVEPKHNLSVPIPSLFRPLFRPLEKRRHETIVEF